MIDYLKSVAIATVVDVADLLAEALDAGAILLRGLGDGLAVHHRDYTVAEHRRIRAERLGTETFAGYSIEAVAAIVEQWGKAEGQ